MYYPTNDGQLCTKEAHVEDKKKKRRGGYFMAVRLVREEISNVLALSFPRTLMAM